MTTPAALPPLVIRLDQTVPVLEIPGELDLDALKAWLDQTVPEHPDGLRDRTVRLDLGDRPIVLLDLRRLIHHLREQWALDVTGLYLRGEHLHRFAERELRLKVFVTEDGATTGSEGDDAPPVADNDADNAEHTDPAMNLPESKLSSVQLPHDLDEADLDDHCEAELPAPTHQTDGTQRTLSLQRTLRSGTVVRFDGDVTLFGDVNPGAQIVATGSIVVLGALKGMAWAGATGDENALILALDFLPTQLRIGRKIAITPDRAPSDPTGIPEMASVLGDQIVIEPYVGKLRSRRTPHAS